MNVDTHVAPFKHGFVEHSFDIGNGFCVKVILTHDPLMHILFVSHGVPEPKQTSIMFGNKKLNAKIYFQLNLCLKKDKGIWKTLCFKTFNWTVGKVPCI